MARVEPRVMSFEDLIDQIGRGVLRVPRFQRSFVWTKAQILQLFKSIRHRYPIGTLLNWSTDKRYTSFDRLGPIQLPPEPVAPAEVSYVLDGHQRVSAIFGALALTDAQAEAMKGKDRIFVVYYDLAEEAFIHKHPRQLEPHHLPVRYLLSKEDRLTTWLDERRDEAKADTPEREAWNLYRRRAGLLQATFAKYQLPYLHVTDADIAEAVQIFRLLNSQGTRVKKLDVFAALTWRPGGFDFSAEANRLIESYPAYANFGTDPVLRSILSCLGESIYEEDWSRIIKEHGARLPDALIEVGEAFGRATRFLAEEVGATSGRVVPYALQLVLLTEFFRVSPAPGDEARAKLRAWFWASSFGSAYSLGGNLAFNEAIDRVRRLAWGEPVELLDHKPQLRPFPRTFHPKSARVRAFHLFLKTLKPRNLATGLPLGEDILKNGMADARQIDGTEVYMAGRILVGAGPRPLGIRDFEQTSQLLERDAVLASHAITQSAFDALLAGQIDAFIALREKDLIRQERAFASTFVEIPGATEEAAEDEPEIDVEDETSPDFA